MKSEDTVWATLFARQMASLEGKACKQFRSGMKHIALPEERLPTREEISKALEPQGWTLVEAENIYLTDDQWFAHLAKKEFPVTGFLRKENELDFTPLPDMFHDFFGHLAFMIHPEILEITEHIATLFQNATEEEKPRIARIWWHTMEFGLLREKEEIKILGAGLISSQKELLHCLNPERQQPFNLQEIMNTPKAIADVHQQFFVLDSLKQLKTSLLHI